jgi:hypothetical protein
MASIAEKLAEFTLRLKPQFVNGRWRGAELSGMRLAKFLKRHPDEEVVQAYHALKATEVKKFGLKEPKGHRRIRERPMRQARIADLLSKSDSVAQKYKSEMRDARAKLRASDPLNMKRKKLSNILQPGGGGSY